MPLNAPLSGLTRRRVLDRRDEHWVIHYQDVPVGQITHVTTGPKPFWQWSCGFYPGSQPGEHRSGTAMSFEEARAAFGKAWEQYAKLRSEDDLEEWRKDRDGRKWMYGMWDAGLPLPTQTQDGRTRCFCGAYLNGMKEAHEHSITVHARPRDGKPPP